MKSEKSSITQFVFCSVSYEGNKDLLPLTTNSYNSNITDFECYRIS